MFFSHVFAGGIFLLCSPCCCLMLLFFSACLILLRKNPKAETLSKAELHELADELAQGLAVQVSKQIFEQMDQDGNGYIDRNEFSAIFSKGGLKCVVFCVMLLFFSLPFPLTPSPLAKGSRQKWKDKNSRASWASSPQMTSNANNEHKC